jgi:SAM-dependent methyltransferase
MLSNSTCSPFLTSPTNLSSLIFQNDKTLKKRTTIPNFTGLANTDYFQNTQNKVCFATENAISKIKPQMDAVQFSGNDKSEEDGLTLSTSFFRDVSTLELISDILQIKSDQSKSKQFKIADYACSTGEEAYSLALILNSQNINYAITGYDIAKKALLSAQKGEVGINDPMQFLKSQEGLAAIIRRNPMQAAVMLRNRLKNTQFQDSYLDKPTPPLGRDRKYFDLFHQHFQKQETDSLPLRAIYQVKPGHDLKCNFQSGDIQDIYKARGSQSTDILLFRNALYHLITTPPFPADTLERKPLNPDNAMKILNDLFRQFNHVLTPGGFLVFGKNEGRQHQQETLVRVALEQAGFKPIFDDFSAPVYQKVRTIE